MINNTRLFFRLIKYVSHFALIAETLYILYENFMKKILQEWSVIALSADVVLGTLLRALVNVGEDPSECCIISPIASS